MNSFWRIFLLETRALVRSGAFVALLAASTVWMFCSGALLKSDGTPEGMREMSLHYSTGGVAALLAVALLASAAGTISGERAAKRLQLSLVRPVGRIVIALGRMAALVAAGAAVLAVAAAIEILREENPRRLCRSELRPVLQSPRDEAAALYESYMADPDTPEEVKKAGRGTVLRILERRAGDRYLTIRPGETAQWLFRMPKRGAAAGTGVRLRFTNTYDLREEVKGALVLHLGDGTELGGAVSNMTRSVMEIPLASGDGITPEAGGEARLEFRNDGTSAIMLRPRRDVELLVPAGRFAGNVLRAWVQLTAMLSMLVAFGVFLGSALGRPVAMFTAMVVLAVSEISPSVIEQYPDPLESDPVDAIGLQLTRVMSVATRPVSSLEPLAELARDACVEPAETARAAFAGFFAAPLVFAMLSALVMPRKSDV